MGSTSQFISKPLFRWLQHQRPLPDTPLSDFKRIRAELKPCDVLLVEGRNRISDVIKTVTQSSWSHAALYIGRQYDVEDEEARVRLAVAANTDPAEPLVVESQLGHGTIVRPLSVYAQEHLRICRPRGLALEDRQRILQFVIERLGLPYDMRQVFDLLRLMLPWSIMPRRWRSSLFQHNPSDNTRMICSTMIAEAFGSVRFPILPLVQIGAASGEPETMYLRNPRLCTPRDFDYSPYFEIIKYPFVDYADKGQYRLLPWSSRVARDDDALLKGEKTT